MKLSKKAIKQLETAINGVLCYQGMLDRANADQRWEDAINAMKWYNERAAELEKLGIEIVKYGVK